MPYLICDRCNGYYELQEGESKEDFQECQCGGNLTFCTELGDGAKKQSTVASSNDIIYDNDDLEHYSENNKEDNNKIKGYKFIFLVLLIFIISLIAAASFSSFIATDNNSISNQSTLGHNTIGYVNKYVYQSSESNNTSNSKIAIITGIHPREPLSKTVWTDLLKNYHVPPGIEIVQYDINVVDEPEDFTLGRNNGETLAATYILPDIIKSNYKMVIVCHDHEPGYGEGFYFATPEMDANSVKFAESLKQKIPDFNYYKNNDNSEKGTSNIHFTDPLVSKGFRAIVYEMPGLSSYNEAYNKTFELLDTSLQNM
jgi:hypothetical protein